MFNSVRSRHHALSLARAVAHRGDGSSRAKDYASPRTTRGCWLELAITFSQEEVDVSRVVNVSGSLKLSDIN